MQRFVDKTSIDVAEQVAFAKDRRSVIDRLLTPGSAEHATYLALLEQVESQESGSFKNEHATSAISKLSRNNDTDAVHDIGLRNAFLEFPTATPSRRATIAKEYLSKALLVPGLPARHSAFDSDNTVKSFLRGITNAVVFPKTSEELVLAELEKGRLNERLNLDHTATPLVLANANKIPDALLEDILMRLPFQFALHPAVVKLVARSLAYTPPNVVQPRSFGTCSVDRELSAAQLKELASEVMSVKTNDTFIKQEIITRFSDVDPAAATSATEREELLQEIFDYAVELAMRGKAQEQYASSIMAYCLSTLLDTDGVYQFDWFKTWTELRHAGSPFLRRSDNSFHRTAIGHFPAPDLQDLSGRFMVEWYRRQPYEKYSPSSLGEWDSVFAETSLVKWLAEARTFYPPIDSNYRSTAPFPDWLLPSSTNDSSKSTLLSARFNFENERKRVLLQWDSSNREDHTTAAAVAAPLELKAIVKNVPRVTVRVFRLNGLGVYRDTWASIASTIDLDGLVPHLVIEKDFSAADPATRITETISVPSLAGCRGSFVVELEGSGQSVRALVHKGSLSFLEHPTASGHAFKVFTESGEAVKDAKVYMGTRVFAADPKSGFVIVPYGDEEKRTPIVLASESAAGGAKDDATAAASAGESFASLAHFTHLAENYNFSASFVVDREALRARSVGDVLIRVSLTRNGIPVASPADVARDAVLTVTAMDTEGVSATQVVEDFALPKAGQDAVHQYSVQAGLASLNFQLTCKVTTARGGEQTLSASCAPFTLNAIESSPLAMQQILLRFDPTAPYPVTAAGGGYVLVVTGKGGEPLANENVTVTLYHSIFRSSVTVTETACTDALGRVRLGMLTDVSEIKACVSTFVRSGSNESIEVSAAFNVARDLGPHFAPSPKYTTEEGQVLRIPFQSSLTCDRTGAPVTVTPERFSLTRMSEKSNAQVESALSCLSLSTESGQLICNGLHEGKYTLSYFPVGFLSYQLVSHTIVVLPKDSRVADNYVRLRPSVYSGNSAHSYQQLQTSAAVDLAIGSITGAPVAAAPAPSESAVAAAAAAITDAGASAIVAAAQDGTAAAAVSEDEMITIQLGGSTVTTRAHVYSHHFTPCMRDLATIAKKAAPDARSIDITSPASCYMSQRELSGEQQYVRDRRNAPRQVGNMLPRPTLFLAKRFKQKTTMAPDAKLREAGAQVQMTTKSARNASMREMTGFIAPMAGGPELASRIMLTSSSDAGAGGSSYGCVSRRGMNTGAQYTSDRSFVNLDFLAQGSSHKLNLTPDENGRVYVRRGDLGAHHTTLTVVAIDGPTHGVVRSVPLRPSTAAASSPAIVVSGATAAAGDTVTANAGCIDTRMPASLNLAKHYAQRQLVTPLLAAGASLPIADVLSARVEAFSSLPELWALFTSLADSSTATLLERFAFLPRWHTLTRAQKEEKFADLLCHELVFFIYCKDKPFFDAVVAPHLRNRHRKTVLDHYVLGHHTRLAHQFSTPLAAGTLNAFERVLVAHASGSAAALACACSLRDATTPINAEERARVFAAALKSRALALGPTTTETLQEEAVAKGDEDDDDGSNGSDSANAGSDAAGSERSAGNLFPTTGDVPSQTWLTGGAPERQYGLGDVVASAAPASAPAPVGSFGGAAAPAGFGAARAPAPAGFGAAWAPAPAGFGAARAPAPAARAGFGAAAYGSSQQSSDPLANALGQQSAPASFMMMRMPAAPSFEQEAEQQVKQSQAAPRALFTSPDTTAEYEEREYFSVPSSSSCAVKTKGLVNPSLFWSDWAKYLAQGASATTPFISENILDISNTTFTEVVLAFAVTGLPAESKSGCNAASLLRLGKGGHGDLVAPAPMLVLHEEEKEIASSSPVGSDAEAPATYASASTMAVTQVYFDPSAPLNLTSDGEPIETYVVGNEFLRQRVYGCRVVLTNVSPLRQKCQVLLQIPVGSVPVKGPMNAGTFSNGLGGKKGIVRTKTVHTDVEAYSTRVVEYFFYFPALGVFGHYPVQVSRPPVQAAGATGAELLGFGTPQQLKVVPCITTPPDTTSWRYISSHGSEDDVIAYLADPAHAVLSLHSSVDNVSDGGGRCVNPAEAAWRCADGKNMSFLLRLTDTLRARGCYHHAIWAQANALGLHSGGPGQQPLSPEYMRVLKEAFAVAMSSKKNVVGPFLRSALFSKDAHDPLVNQFQHLEYLPLINSRAHAVNGSSSNSDSKYPIQNLQLREQYRKFVTYFTFCCSSLSTAPLSQLLSGTYYMLLLDRIPMARIFYEEALSRKAAADQDHFNAGDDMEMQLQLDYLAAFFEFYALAAGDAGSGGVVSVEALVAGAARARAIAAKYSTYPVRFWRKLFSDVVAQIDEAVAFTDSDAFTDDNDDDAGFALIDDEGCQTTHSAAAAAAALKSSGLREKNEVAEDRDANRGREMYALASTEPSLEMEVLTLASSPQVKGDSGSKDIVVRITHTNISSCRVCFYTMDLEALFSTSPFLMSSKTEKFASVAPNAAVLVDLSASPPSTAAGGACVTDVPIPAELKAAGNLHIEVTSGELSTVRRATHFAHGCAVTITEGYGQVKVAAVITTGGRKVLAPLPGAYVKCFAKLKNGVTDFYKDGYTDLRGCFDYASLSTDKLKHVERFALLVVTDTHGSCVKEAAPPTK